MPEKKVARSAGSPRAPRGGAAHARSRGPRSGPDVSTRERILDIALDLFIEQGYDKASLRELAQRMGFTKAALYYHFSSKADILMALHLRMHALIDRPLKVLDDLPVGRDGFERFLDLCIDEMQANQKLFVLHRVNQAALSQMHQKGHEGAHVELEERARRLFSEPSLSAEDRLRMSAAFAAAFVTPMMGGFFNNMDVDEEFTEGLKRVVHHVLHVP